MLKKYYPILLFFVIMCCLSDIHAQQQDTTQWASKVISYSSSYKQGIIFKNLNYAQYPAMKALGRPDVLPGNTGDSPNAWVPHKPDESAFIAVGFDKPMRVQQIAIAESMNPGAVSEIYCYDEQNNEHLVAMLEPEAISSKARMFNVFIDPTKYKVKSIKIVLDGASIPGYHAIDAIAISSSAIPVNAFINIAASISKDIAIQKIHADADNEHINLNPLVTPDGKTMFFSRRSERNVGGYRDLEDIWYMERENPTDTWSKPVNAGRPLNNKGNNFVSTISPDGETYSLLLGNAYLPKNKMQAGVSTSKKTTNGWSTPRPMPIMDFYNFSSSAHYFLSEDRQYLVMAIEREDSKGETDLYISFNRGDDTWTTPLNLGNLNTPDIESSPFMADDNATIYFSSRGYSGFGMQDVYRARRLDDTWQKWSEPENLGPAINSSKDDLFFTISHDEQQAYITRANADSAQLFQLSMPIFNMPAPSYLVTGQVYNVRNNAPVTSEVILYHQADSSESISVHTDEAGKFAIELKEGDYAMYAKSEGYATLNKIDLLLEGSFIDKPIQRDLYLLDQQTLLSNNTPSIVENLVLNREAVVSERVMFEYNSYALKSSIYQHLDDVAIYLKSNPKAQLLIEGHTSSEGSRSYNKELSLKRAKAVSEYIQYKGIKAGQLKVKGYGEEKPRYSEGKANGKEKNRRVEFKLIH